jgi:DNA-binding transcriptional LysR family regulator
MMEKARIDFSLRQLRYFVTAAESLSITEAAKRLHISQPSVSTAVSTLEEIFTTQLFNRNASLGLTLTPAGHLLAREARTLLKSAADLHSTLHDFSDAGSGTLSVGFLVTLAPFLLPMLTKRFQLQFPRAELIPQEGSQTFLLDALTQGRLDCVITYDLKIPENLAFLPVLDLPPLVLLPGQHRLAAQKTLRLADLQDEMMVQLDLPLSREYFEALFASAGVVPRIGYRSAYTDVVHSMVAEGLGYTLWNFPPHQRVSASGMPFVVRHLDESFPPLRLGIVSMVARSPRRIVEGFLKFSESELRRLTRCP